MLNSSSPVFGVGRDQLFKKCLQLRLHLFETIITINQIRQLLSTHAYQRRADSLSHTFRYFGLSTLDALEGNSPSRVREGVIRWHLLFDYSFLWFGIFAILLLICLLNRGHESIDWLTATHINFTLLDNFLIPPYSWYAHWHVNSVTNFLVS